MQVFVPFESFAHSLAVLDRARLGKQRMECRQIMTALRAARHDRTVGWANHPATIAWVGHESALAVYLTLCINEWVARGYNNTMITPYDENWQLRPGEDPYLDRDGRSAVLPSWVGDPAVHASHRSNLLRKDPEYYAQMGWSEPADMEYVWPTPNQGEPA